MTAEEALAVSGSRHRSGKMDPAVERSQLSTRVPVVGLDLRPTEPGFKAHFGRGTGRYAAELISAISRIIAADQSEHGLRGALPPIDIRLLGGKDLSPSEREKRIVKKMPLGRLTIETQLLFPFRVRRCNTDLVHFFHHGDAPAWCPRPYVVTVLDLIPLKLSHLYQTGPGDWRFRLARALELRAIRSARGIMAISDATKKDLVEILNVDPERIVVTRLAVGGQFEPSERFSGGAPVGTCDLEAYKGRLRERLGIETGRPMLLYVGGIDRRKQVPFLFDVTAELAQLRQSAGLSKPLLVVAGNYTGDKLYPELLQSAKSAGVEQDVKFTGYLPEDDLLDLYRAADLTLFPSLYEGFGFPVLESISCGVPVIARSNSSIPEVVGVAAGSGPVIANGAVLMPDSAPAADWARQIERLLERPEFAAELAAAGVARAATFSWDRTARETLFAYKRFSIGGLR